MAVPAQAWGAFAKTSLNCRVPRRGPDEHDGDGQPEIADAVDQERLFARVGGRGFLEPEADQQVGRQADPFPAHVKEQVVVRQHQRQHHQDEEVEVGEEAREAGIVVHIAGGIDVDQEADAGDDQRHGDRELVEQQRDVDLEIAGDHPLPQHDLVAALFRGQAEHGHEHPHGHAEAQQHHAGREPRDDPLTQPCAEQRDDQRPQGGEQKHQPSVFKHGNSPTRRKTKDQ